VSDGELVAFVCCDLGAIVRGRSVLSSELDAHRDAGVGWVPANHALTPIGSLADPSPFGSTGDLRLLPALDTHVRLEPGNGDVGGAFELVLCDIAEPDGQPWECCPRNFLRDALAELERELGLRLVASFEHEFQLHSEAPAALPFSLEAQRRAAPFPEAAMAALLDAGIEPERFMPEYASHQFEIPVAPSEGIACADRAVLFREIVREIARRVGSRVSFTPLLESSEAGNGVHIHLSLLDEDGSAVLYDERRPGSLSELGGRFAAGVLLHARALSALTAPSPVSAARLAPHRWSAGAACLGAQNRETLLRLPPFVAGIGDAATQLRLEYRGADAAANPYLALGAIVRAGLDGVRRRLTPAPLLERDPALLDDAQADTYGVDALPSSLAEALQALADDETARGWLSPLLYEAYLAVKQTELEAAAGVELGELCERYGSIY
jgi:glutamine synthetase